MQNDIKIISGRFCRRKKNRRKPNRPDGYYTFDATAKEGLDVFDAILHANGSDRDVTMMCMEYVRHKNTNKIKVDKYGEPITVARNYRVLSFNIEFVEM